MLVAESNLVIYWDASAIISVLFSDNHSDSAMALVEEEGFHLISTLVYAETCAVITRLQRERVLADVLIQAAFDALLNGPWRHLAFLPDWEMVRSLSTKWPLRGADLWHLAAAKGLQIQLPELCLLTFDVRLREAAKGEDLVRE